MTHTGVTVSGGPRNYTVDVAGISGVGTLSLAVSTSSDVQNLAGNPLTASVTSAPISIVEDLPVAGAMTLVILVLTLIGLAILRRRTV